MPPIISARYDRTYRYDFATDGGAVGAIPLRGDKLPSGAVVVDALLQSTPPPRAAAQPRYGSTPRRPVTCRRRL
jgi:hypothetical protein